MHSMGGSSYLLEDAPMVNTHSVRIRGISNDDEMSMIHQNSNFSTDVFANDVAFA